MVSIISIGIILVFSAMAIFSGAFQWANLWNIAPDPGQTEFLPHGVLPILFALPFAMWFFLGIEELPLAAEEAHNPVRDIPKAGFWARGTLIVTGLLVLFLKTGVIGGEATVRRGRAAAGRLPRDRSATSSPRSSRCSRSSASSRPSRASCSRTGATCTRSPAPATTRVSSPSPESARLPGFALTIGAVIGFIALVVLDTVAALNEGAGAVAGAIVLNIAVWGAVLAYLLQMISFV